MTQKNRKSEAYDALFNVLFFMMLICNGLIDWHGLCFIQRASLGNISFV
jgi:hypothetical protein